MLDLSKQPFVKEFKQIIDMHYSLNLPKALGIQPLVPADSLLQADVF